jgi:FAD/FMN-containing dehydrogenase
MAPLPEGSLRARAPWRVEGGFGGAVRSAGRTVTPGSLEELSQVFSRAKREGLKVAFRGSGRSYGDAALNRDGLLLDLSGLSRVTAWDPKTGILSAEGGLTIEGLWRRALLDGYWPAVVPGTMRPTLAGCLSMNVHGKNNPKLGTFGEHVVDFHLLLPRGDILRCSREENPDVFHAAIGGLGLLGAVTRMRLQLKKVESGYLRVNGVFAQNLPELFTRFEQELAENEYVVGWVDGLAPGKRLGSGVIHSASPISAEEDPDGERSFLPEAQSLPGRVAGMPKTQLWRFMKPFTNTPGVRAVNAVRRWLGEYREGHRYLQSYVAFNFLLDYVPNWWLAYGRGGLIQYQVFAPHAKAQELFSEVLWCCQKARLPSYLAVLKRHRPDPFLLTHALDGWSLAMDFQVTEHNRSRLWALTEKLTDAVLAAGGRFYLAKDAVLRAQDLERAYGPERLEAFRSIKKRLDPDQLISSELSRRLLGF